MRDKIVVIISSGEAEKARTGAMYAVNALKHGWMKEVALFLFGPAEELFLEDKPLHELIFEYIRLGEIPVACKFIADKDNTNRRIEEVGVAVEYVGQDISDLIKEGYVPMVW